MVEHRKRKCYPVPFLSVEKHRRSKTARLQNLGKAGKERSRMSILTHPQDDKVECGPVAIAEERLEVLLIVCRGPLCSALSLDPLNILLRDRNTEKKQFMNKSEVAVNMFRRDASLVRPEQVDTLPCYLIAIRFHLQKRVELSRRAASG